jgi:hypothetical protein
MNLAPISISVYSRLNHFSKTIDSLLQNELAAHSLLYIFSDAPKPGDEKIIQSVRDYAKGISGFKKVLLIEQPNNCYFKNMRDAMIIPLENHGTLIRLEDDVLVSRNFLKFMNDSLSLYSHDDNVFAITGYTPNISLKYNQDVFLSRDFSAWGFATWRTKGFIEALEIRDYYTKIKRDKKSHLLIKRLHPKMMNTLAAIQQRKTDPDDYKLTAYMLLNCKFVVRPLRTLTKNIGFDGSGVGQVITSTFDVELDDRFDPKIRSNLTYNRTLDESIFDSYFRTNKLDFFVYLIKSRIKLVIYDLKLLYQRNP